MRIATHDALSALTWSPRPRGAGRPGLLRRLDHYTRWAFNPQRELTTRYEREA